MEHSSSATNHLFFLISRLPPRDSNWLLTVWWIRPRLSRPDSEKAYSLFPSVLFFFFFLHPGIFFSSIRVWNICPYISHNVFLSAFCGVHFCYHQLYCHAKLHQVYLVHNNLLLTFKAFCATATMLLLFCCFVLFFTKRNLNYSCFLNSRSY